MKTIQEDQFRNSCGIIGELILWANVLDLQLNEVCILALLLSETPLLKPVVAMLDTSRKIEIIKVRAKTFPETVFKEKLLNYAKSVEKVIKVRNIAAHSYVGIQNGVPALFSIQYPKLIQSLDRAKKELKGKSISEFERARENAKSCASEGEVVINNLSTLKEEFKERYG